MNTGIQVGMVAIALAGMLAGCSSSEPASGGAASSASLANSCINPIDIQRQTIVSDDEIRFEMRNGETWANKLSRSCHGLKFNQGFSWEVRGTLVCSNQQTIRVKDEGTTCMLGEFSKLPSAGQGS